MKLKVVKSESYDWSIVLDEKDLRRLDEILKTSFNNSQEVTLEYNIKCSDGSLIETEKINEVVSEENSKNHHIESIGISAISKETSKQINISFLRRAFSNSVSYSISGDSRDWVYLTSSKIEERIKNTKQWYSIVPKIFSGFFLFMGFFLFILIYSFFRPKSEPIESMIIYVVGAYLIIKVYNYLFPQVVFRIGDEIKLDDHIVKLRGQIFWGIIVSSIVSIIAGLMII